MKITHHLVYAFSSMSIWFSDSPLFLSVFRLFSLSLFILEVHSEICQHLRELNYMCRLWNEICCRCVYTAGLWLRFCGDSVSRSVEKKHTALSIFSKHFNFKKKGRPNLKDTSAFHELCASAVKALGMNTNITYSPSEWLTSTHGLFQSHNPSVFAIKKHWIKFLHFLKKMWAVLSMQNSMPQCQGATMPLLKCSK